MTRSGFTSWFNIKTSSKWLFNGWWLFYPLCQVLSVGGGMVVINMTYYFGAYLPLNADQYLQSWRGQLYWSSLFRQSLVGLHQPDQRPHDAHHIELNVVGKNRGPQRQRQIHYSLNILDKVNILILALVPHYWPKVMHMMIWYNI